MAYGFEVSWPIELQRHMIAKAGLSEALLDSLVDALYGV